MKLKIKTCMDDPFEDETRYRENWNRLERVYSKCLATSQHKIYEKYIQQSRMLSTFIILFNLGMIHKFSHFRHKTSVLAHSSLCNDFQFITDLLKDYDKRMRPVKNEDDVVNMTITPIKLDILSLVISTAFYSNFKISGRSHRNNILLRWICSSVERRVFEIRRPSRVQFDLDQNQGVVNLDTWHDNCFEVAIFFNL